jgi:trimethylamine--corrinoid protein Co-methyltransferase
MIDKQITFAAATLSYLNQEKSRKIHHATLQILEQTGCEIHHPAVRNLLKRHGAKVDLNQRVHIPEALVERALTSAPSRIAIYDRLKEPAMQLEQCKVYYGTGSDCQYVLDLDTGEPRDFTLTQVEQAVRIADSLPHIDFVMSMGLAPDLDESVTFQKKYRAMLENTTKPLVVISGPDMRALGDIVAMASSVAGSREVLRERPSFLLLVNPTSPLVHSGEALDKLVFMAANRLPVIYAPGIMAGATSPVTMAGAIVQANAEILAGLVVHQLTNPGAPFVYGGGMSPMDMKSSQPTYAAPEAMVSQAGLCQLGRELYKLPTWGFGGCSAAKICDQQAINEAATYNLMAAWSGTNLVHDVGYLEFGRTYSLELLVLCNEFIGQVRRMMEGIVVDEEQLALEVIDRVGPGGTFLMDPHTMMHFKRNWQPELTDRKTRKTWQKNGSRTMAMRAKEKIGSILAAYRPAPLEETVVKKIDAIIAMAKKR